MECVTESSCATFILYEWFMEHVRTARLLLLPSRANHPTEYRESVAREGPKEHRSFDVSAPFREDDHSRTSASSCTAPVRLHGQSRIHPGRFASTTGPARATGGSAVVSDFLSLHTRRSKLIGKVGRGGFGRHSPGYPYINPSVNLLLFWARRPPSLPSLRSWL